MKQPDRLLLAWIALSLSPLTLPAAEPVVLVPTNSVWKYLDDGSNQGTAWVSPDFIDSSWPSGRAKLGYGDGDEGTVVGYGPNSQAKYPTTYFRHTFNVADPSAFQSARVSLLRDDGGIVYLNGTEIFRDHMPEGDVTYLTYASGSAVGGAEETTFFTALVNPNLLVGGLCYQTLFNRQAPCPQPLLGNFISAEFPEA